MMSDTKTGVQHGRLAKREINKAINAEPMRWHATHILHLHAGLKSGAAMMVAQAMAIGLHLVKAKEELPHGAFEAWRAKYISGISDATLARYKLLAEALLSIDPKSLTVSLLLRDPRKWKPADAKKILPAIRDLVDGRSLSDLYRDLGIIKPSPAKQLQEALDGGMTAEQLAAKRGAQCLAEVQDWCARLTQMELNFEDPAPVEQTVEVLRGTLKALTGKDYVPASEE